MYGEYRHCTMFEKPTLASPVPMRVLTDGKPNCPGYSGALYLSTKVASNSEQ